MRTLLFSSAIVLLAPLSVSAYDINMPGFTGTVNTTVTSGFSVRTGERNCLLQDGISYNATTANLNTDGQAALTAAVNAGTLASNAQALVGGDKNYLFSNTCARFQTDAYGNTSTNRIHFGNVNADNGNLNFDQGDVIDATQKAFVELSGSTPDGLGVNFSFIGNYNPVLDVNGVNFIDLTQEAKDELESDVDLLDAYITTSFDAGDDFGFIDVTAGRFVTSWGEATFIPVGLNGLTTNALDLTKLRAPGASIRDALVPTEQISLSFSAGNVGFEVYTQFSADSVEVDPKGSFFGNDVVGTGGDRILASGGYESEFGHEASCPGYAVIVDGLSCDKDLHDLTLATATRATYNDAYNILYSFQNATETQWTYWTGIGAAVDHGKSFGASFTQVDNTLAAMTTTDAADIANLSAVYNGLDDVDFTKAATVELRQNEQKHAYANDDGQWGIRASAYLDGVGTGVDLGFYYANYHSKVPYIQMMGKTGVLAGDIIGAFTAINNDFLGLDGSEASALDNTNHSVGGVGVAGALSAAALLKPYINGAYGAGVCSGLGAALGHSAVTTGSATTTDSEVSKRLYRALTYDKNIDGVGKVHDPSTCAAANGAYQNIFLTLTPTLAAAVTPLNYAEYQFIYPEDNQVFGMSFSTNVSGTVVQGEVSYRPDFPLATASGDQINQIADASGTSLALTAFGHDTYALAPANITAGATLPAVVNNLATASAISKDFGTLLKSVQRSSLPVIDPSLVKVYDATSYYRSTAFINYDVWSADIGTTTTFTASHPLTKGLGADSSFLLTELAMVQIQDMDDLTKGFVARGGFNEGSGEHLCLGIFRNLSGAEIAAVNANSGLDAIDYDLSTIGGVTNVGASIVDAVFGNGSYCEGQMGADERSFSYRLVGGATYQNAMNSAWTLQPSFVWSHDPSGYGPSSLGGFTEGRQSLSLSLTASKGDAIQASINYIEQMGEETDNLRADMDYLSASVSYAF